MRAERSLAPFFLFQLKLSAPQVIAITLLALLMPITSAIDEFRDLLSHKAEVSVINANEWDPRGDYAYIIEAVRAAAGTDEVKVYRIQHDHTRVEYYVVGLDSESSRIVGMKAKAIES